MLNYHYDRDAGVYELYYGDTLIVELPHADYMSEQKAKDLADELFKQYMENKNA